MFDLDGIVKEFNGMSNHKADGNGRTYRRVRIREWPIEVHYEFTLTLHTRSSQYG